MLKDAMEEFDALICNLKVISRVSRNGRLRRVGKGMLTIEDESYILPLKRYLMKSSRTQCLQDLNCIYAEAFQEGARLTESSSVGARLWSGDTQKIDVLQKELAGSLVGLGNLKTTYQSDVSMSVGLDMLQEKIRSYLDTGNGRDTGTKAPP